MTEPVYRRVVVKVSGEASMGPDSFGIHQPTLERHRGRSGGRRKRSAWRSASWSAAATSFAA